MPFLIPIAVAVGSAVASVAAPVGAAIATGVSAAAGAVATGAVATVGAIGTAGAAVGSTIGTVGAAVGSVVSPVVAAVTPIAQTIAPILTTANAVKNLAGGNPTQALNLVGVPGDYSPATQPQIIGSQPANFGPYPPAGIYGQPVDSRSGGGEPALSAAAQASGKDNTPLLIAGAVVLVALTSRR